MEMTAAFATFANQGLRMKPYLITRITDRDGNIIEEARPAAKDAIRADTAYIMTSLLRGRGASAAPPPARASLKRPIAGKTGTTNDFTDALVHRLRARRWPPGSGSASTRRSKSLGRGTRTGSQAALPIWMDFWARGHEGQAGRGLRRCPATSCSCPWTRAGHAGAARHARRAHGAVHRRARSRAGLPRLPPTCCIDPEARPRRRRARGRRPECAGFPGRDDDPPPGGRRSHPVRGGRLAPAGQRRLRPLHRGRPRRRLRRRRAPAGSAGDRRPRPAAGGRRARPRRRAAGRGAERGRPPPLSRGGRPAAQRGALPHALRRGAGGALPDRLRPQDRQRQPRDGADARVRDRGGPDRDAGRRALRRPGGARHVGARACEAEGWSRQVGGPAAPPGRHDAAERSWKRARHPGRRGAHPAHRRHGAGHAPSDAGRTGPFSTSTSPPAA